LIIDFGLSILFLFINDMFCSEEPPTTSATEEDSMDEEELDSLETSDSEGIVMSAAEGVRIPFDVDDQQGGLSSDNDDTSEEMEDEDGIFADIDELIDEALLGEESPVVPEPIRRTENVVKGTMPVAAPVKKSSAVTTAAAAEPPQSTVLLNIYLCDDYYKCNTNKLFYIFDT